MKILMLALLSTAAMAVACSDRQGDQPSPKRSGELATKREYSVLEGVESQERSRVHAGAPLVRKHALDSEYDAIGLPLKGSNRGYVWIIAKSDTLPDVKVLPEDAPFTVTPSQVADVAKQVVLSKEVQDYLNAHATK
jgi:hypothetical protein